MSHLDDFFWIIAKIVCTCFVEYFPVGLFTMLHKVTWTVESVWVWPFKWKIFGNTVWCCARWLGMNSQSVTTPMKAIERYFTTRCWGDSKSCLWKSQSATTQRKAVEQYFHVVLFTVPFKPSAGRVWSQYGELTLLPLLWILRRGVVPNFESPDEIQRWLSNETCSADLSSGAFVMLYKVVLTFESVGEIPKCDNWSETYWAALSFGIVYYVVQSGCKF